VQPTVFIEKMPTIEIRDGIFFIIECETGGKSALSIYLAKQLVRRAQAVLALHDAQQAEVIRDYRRVCGH